MLITLFFIVEYYYYYWIPEQWYNAFYNFINFFNFDQYLNSRNSDGILIILKMFTSNHELIRKTQSRVVIVVLMVINLNNVRTIPWGRCQDILNS